MMWIYDVRHNAWRSINAETPQKDCLTQEQTFRMLILCKQVVLTYCSNHVTWAFNVNKSWTRLRFVDQFVQPPIRQAFSAVTVPDPSTVCQCKESILIFGGKSPTTNTILEDLWELQCVKDEALYSWRQRKEHVSTYDIGHGARYDHVTISAFNSTMMYIYGGYSIDSTHVLEFNNHLLTYNVWSNTWNETHSPFKSDILHGVFLNLPFSMLVYFGHKEIAGYRLIDKRWFPIREIGFDVSTVDIERAPVVAFGSKIWFLDDIHFLVLSMYGICR